MPRFEYRCSGCGKTKEVVCKFDAISPRCCGGNMLRVFQFAVGKVKGAGESPARTSIRRKND
jgi:putative FmdB family regulatory protein